MTHNTSKTILPQTNERLRIKNQKTTTRKQANNITCGIRDACTLHVEIGTTVSHAESTASC